MEAKRGKFVIADGLDGCGKGTIVNALKTWAQEKGMKVFDLREFNKTNSHIPELDEIGDCDVILSAEPTFSHIGKIIREEIIKNNDREYSGMLTAQAFSLDRKVLYKKLILPALAKGIHVFQERGVVTSLVYQPVQLEELTLGEIVNLPGNAFTLMNPPDLLIIPLVDPAAVIKRLHKRTDKQDDAIFETLEFQTKIKDRYSSDWLREMFEKKGTRVVYLDTNPPSTVEDTQKKVIKIWDEFLENHT